MQETIPIPPGLLPIGQSPAVEIPAAVPNDGRRRSLESESIQTVSEPEPVPSRSNTPRPSALPPIPEHESSQASSRPPKVPRLGSSDFPEQSSASSSTMPSTHTRAPGSPVGPLLRGVHQGPPPPHMVLFPDEDYTPEPLTHGEDLSGAPGRVARQVEEFEEKEERERSPRRPNPVTPVQAARSEDTEESLPTWFQEQGWSGTVENYYFNGSTDFVLHQGKWTLMAKRGDEISLKDLSAKEKELFEASDQAEWDAILGTKAVRVITGAAAMQIRKSHSDRVISSRMVRRRKPQPGLNAWKAKSRWCLHGHSDPDTGSLRRPKQKG